ncbi:Gfo/Idh/MocA family protein [Couchioplanes caeruleus]|uniref:Putative dehydrogenase n=1 Tax=Couchioplanes caeruleus TaxID=56438 RepID=A0A3N1GGU3_9ACTN|nr:Gfo/Idh/MocA family oxidoreductase [Couchioplanes caeruleus]ROP29502.1 putative dehydrogenase [Couchioplanes caeruleus]
MLRFAVIGCGNIGALHARLIAEATGRAALVAVLGRTPARAGPLARRYGCDWSTDLADLLARDDVDAVSVCTPSGTHGTIALAALERGKHVLVEKPIDIDVATADRLIAASRRHDRRLGVVSQHRFDPATRVVAEALRAGRLGVPTAVQVEVPLWRSPQYYATGGWRGTRAMDGGGALMNQGVHLVDLMLALCGPAVEVDARTARRVHEGIEVEDVVAATIHFASGALGTLLATTAAYPGLTTRLAVYGSRGSAVIDNDRLAYFHAAAEGDDVGGFGAYGAANQAAAVLPADPEWEADRDPYGMPLRPHRDQIADFCDAVARGRAPHVDGAEGRRALALVRAVYAAAETGRPVRIEPA